MVETRQPAGSRRPAPDYGESSYRGECSTAGSEDCDYGRGLCIGRAVAVAPEGADVLRARFPPPVSGQPAWYGA